MIRLRRAFVTGRNAKRNAFLLLFSVAFFLASWLVANVSIGEAVNWVSAMFIVIIAAPSYYYLVRWAGVKKGVAVIVVLGILPVIVEAIGISTGLPYGGFYYTDMMGLKIFDLVPWSVAFAFGPLVLGTMSLAILASKDWRVMLPLSALLLVFVDLVLDPAAVVLNIWVWLEPGPYYGIPITNYTGWFVTALAASAILHIILSGTTKEVAEIPVEIAGSLLISVSFWTGYSFWTGLWIPVVIGILMIAGTLYVILASDVEMIPLSEVSART
ncbi:carotenoid biosynthesis protein [Candidatus Thorarchaeota archaeon]|nr:MAG: carotenoid biosynthesis protein [Candidatus Thorarchaeota archaeon]